MTVSAALLSSDRDDWNTPRVVLDLARAVAPIWLDPAWNPASITNPRLRYHLAEGQDGLRLPWTGSVSGPGLVWVNPPYGRGITAWTAKMAAEAKAGAEIIALLPARPDTAWWHEHIAPADAVCFWAGRLTFLGAPAGAPFPSALAYWGERAKRFRAVFGGHGWIVEGRR